MFDTFLGLPLHALLLHAVVVGIPLMSVVSIAVAVRPTWRHAAAVPVAVANIVLTATTWVTAEAGEALQSRLGGAAAEHGERGELLPWFVLALAAASVAVAFARRREAAWHGTVAVVAVVVFALAATGWTMVVGHSGTEAVWSAIVEGTNPS